MVSLYPDMIGKAFGMQRLCPVTVASEWYETFAKVNQTQIKLHFTISRRDTITPFRMPLSIANRFMDIQMAPEAAVSNEIKAITKYLHLHDTSRTCKTATSLSFKEPYLWIKGAVLLFRVTMGQRGDVCIPIISDKWTLLERVTLNPASEL